MEDKINVEEMLVRHIQHTHTMMAVLKAMLDFIKQDLIRIEDKIDKIKDKVR